MVSKKFARLTANKPSKLAAWLCTALILTISALSNIALAAELVVSTDRSELSQDEHLVLTFSLYSSDTHLRAQGVQPNIDLTLLTNNFDLGTPRNNVNYNIFRNRGRASSSLEVELFPKSTGNFVIPSFSVDSASSEVINIKVLPSKYADAPLAFSRGGVSQNEVWQRQQLIIYVDTYYRVELASAKLGGPIETEPMPLDVLEHYRLPTSERSEQLNGFTYQIKRASWSLFPLESGTLTIHLPDTWIVTANQQQLRLPQEILQVNVKALPVDLSSDVLIGKPTLSFTPVQTSNKVGVVNSWHAQISAPIAFNDLPNTLALPTTSSALTIFVDNKRDSRIDNSDGILQVANYTVSASAQSPGQFQLPTIELRYFDTEDALVKTATAASPMLIIDETNMPAISPAQMSAERTEQSHTRPANGFWILTTLACAALWLITLTYFINKQRRQRVQTTTPPQPGAREAKPTSPRPLEHQLLQAFNSPSLSQGLKQWQNTHGHHPLIDDTVHQVQTLYYANTASLTISLDTLKDNVKLCCDEIMIKPSLAVDANDPWEARSFTKRLNPDKTD